MFMMIGGDGREYGPVTADQLREWILDHRADAQTMVRAENTRDWVPLGSLTEFGEVLGESARLHGLTLPAAGTPTGAVPEPVTSAAPRAFTGEFEVVESLGRAWQFMQRHFLLIWGATGLAWAIRTVPQLLPGATGCAGLIASVTVSGAVFGGVSVLVIKLIRGEPAELRDEFGCFDRRFVPCLLVYVVTGVLEELGLALCLLPGVFVGTVWAFSLPLAADRGLGFVESLATSWRGVMPRFFRVLGFLAVAWLPMVVFAAYSTARMVGHVQEVLGPPASWDLVALTEKFPEVAERGARLGMQRELVLLLNLPFAWTALMVAYEQLFGRGRTSNA